MESAPPPRASLLRTFALEVPVDAGAEDDLIIHEHQSPPGETFLRARITEVMPQLTEALRMRISIAVERALGQMFEELYEQAAANMERQAE